ncbi:hypothetical protein BJX63DRAFT_379452 [Aspergillus granulosus]|uniref:Uncharacterized protein n=1 Tax=Aspergillus granulosus TaxID=176169 RepID=A0ABR4I058_9EURO
MHLASSVLDSGHLNVPVSNKAPRYCIAYVFFTPWPASPQVVRRASTHPLSPRCSEIPHLDRIVVMWISILVLGAGIYK